ncbi:MAG: hypothetical protein GF411_20605 [Candidatus Lokiarchaeota archaeon]|nr:hypothetical protein [Candidatus Lokiarchaeota archaeon]
MKWSKLAGGCVLLIMIISIPAPVSAGSSSTSFAWQNGLIIHTHSENHDFWVPGANTEAYLILTLMSKGATVKFYDLTVFIKLITETNVTGQITINDPWKYPGDTIRVKGSFNLTPEMINNAGWETYRSSYIYWIESNVRLSNGDNVTLSSFEVESTTLTMSTITILAFWPFPPIILMFGVYWLGAYGLTRFNERYLELEAAEREAAKKKKDDDKATKTTDDKSSDA